MGKKDAEENAERKEIITKYKKKSPGFFALGFIVLPIQGALTSAYSA